MSIYKRPAPSTFGHNRYCHFTLGQEIPQNHKISELCNPKLEPHYVGSSVKFKARWSTHKSDMTRGIGKDCGFCEHWARHHRDNLTDMYSIKIYLLDFCEDPGRKEEDFPLLKNLEERWMVSLGSLGSLDPVQGCNKRDDAKAKARFQGT